MKFISFNPWKKIMLKSIIDDDNYMVDAYKKELEDNGNSDFFIGVTEPDEHSEHPFEELNFVCVDSIAFSDVPEIMRRELENDDLYEAFMEVY